MRQALALLLPLLALAACDRSPNFNNKDGSLDRNGYRVQATGDCAERLERERTTLGEADKNQLCSCIGETVERESTDEQLRDYLNRYLGRGAMPPEVSQRAQQQCQARLAAPPPVEEPGPIAGYDGSPPVTRQGAPQPNDGPAPGGGELADGPDAGGGASAPGGTRARVSAGTLARYITADDYPAAALRNNEQGRVAFVLEIGPNGRVANCAVTESSGSRQLDNATCLIMQSRARYTPARNARGDAVADRDRAVVRWALPEG